MVGAVASVADKAVGAVTRRQWFRLCASYDRDGRTFLWGNQARGAIRYRWRGRDRLAWG